jgi:hypothetical protein
LIKILCNRTLKHKPEKCAAVFERIMRKQQPEARW